MQEDKDKEVKAGVHYIRLQSDEVFSLFNEFKKSVGLNADAAIESLLSSTDAKQIRIQALKKELARLER